MYASQIIADTYKTWKRGDRVILAFDPGRGKTTFILGPYLQYVKENGGEILYLVNRKILEAQLFQEICAREGIPPGMFEDQSIIELSGITFMTYQTAEQILDPENVLQDMPFYSAVVMDEIAYLSTDAEINPKVMRTASYIKKLSLSTVIFISATIESVVDYILPDWDNWFHVASGSCLEVYQNKMPAFTSWSTGIPQNLYWYSAPARKQKFKVVVFDTEADIAEMINHDNSGSKWLVFQSNKTKAKNGLIPNITKSVSMVTASDKNSDTMKTIINEKRFDEEVLVATKVMDVGVSLHDSKILNIVMNADNEYDYIQMLGRRRIKKDENVTLNIFVPRKSLEYFRTRRIKDIEKSLKFLNLTAAERLKEILSSEDARKKANKLCDIKEDKLVPNWIAKSELEKKQKLFLSFEEGLEEDPDYFVKKQISWLGEGNVIEVVDYSQVKTIRSLKELYSILDTKINIEMGKAAQNEFRSDVNPILRYLLPQKFPNGNTLPGINLINQCLKQLEIPIKIISISQHTAGEETKWVLKRIVHTSLEPDTEQGSFSLKR